MFNRISMWFFEKKKKSHIRNKIKITYMKVWDLEFLLEKMKSMKEGFRREHDRFNENIDAARRKMYDEKYTFYYSETNDVINVQNLPLTYEDIEKLPNIKTSEWRYHKIDKPNLDKTITDNLDNFIKKMQPDVEQLKKQMDDIDSQIEGQGGINESIEGFRTVVGLLKDYLKKI